jgi:hypothetical protein
VFISEDNTMSLYITTQPDGTFPGWGNQIILASQYYAWCRARGSTPIICTDHPERIVNFKNEFQIVTETDEPKVEFPISLRAAFCTDYTCFYQCIVNIPVPEPQLPPDIVAGFSFRIATPAIDTTWMCMNATAIDTMVSMIHKITKNGRVYVTSNSHACLESLNTQFGDKIVTHESQGTDTHDTRKQSSLVKWLLLSQCPYIVHFVRAPDDPPHVITTTYAPTAAAYGNKPVVGVDSHGRVVHGRTYHW